MNLVFLRLDAFCNHLYAKESEPAPQPDSICLNPNPDALTTPRATALLVTTATPAVSSTSSQAAQKPSLFLFLSESFLSAGANWCKSIIFVHGINGHPDKHGDTQAETMTVSGPSIYFRQMCPTVASSRRDTTLVLWAKTQDRIHCPVWRDMWLPTFVACAMTPR